MWSLRNLINDVISSTEATEGMLDKTDISIFYKLMLNAWKQTSDAMLLQHWIQYFCKKFVFPHFQFFNDFVHGWIKNIKIIINILLSI